MLICGLELGTPLRGSCSHLRRGGAHAVFLGPSCVSMLFWSASESSKFATLTVGTTCRSGGREKVEEAPARI